MREHIHGKFSKTIGKQSHLSYISYSAKWLYCSIGGLTAMRVRDREKREKIDSQKGVLSAIINKT